MLSQVRVLLFGPNDSVVELVNTSAPQAEDSEFEPPLSHQLRTRGLVPEGGSGPHLYGGRLVSIGRQNRSEAFNTGVRLPLLPPTKIVIRGR